jgi:hypothetical protein
VKGAREGEKMPVIFKFCPLTRELCEKVKIVRKLKGCAVVEILIKNMDKCPNGKEAKP